MAYTLQPGLTQIDKKAIPGVCADETFFVYPQPSSLHYCCRPSTMEYGTAPYMAGKGAPAELISLDDELRPQSTTRFNKVLVRTYERNFFPLQDLSCIGPAPTMTYDPTSSRANLQNAMFNQRYCSSK